MPIDYTNNLNIFVKQDEVKKFIQEMMPRDTIEYILPNLDEIMKILRKNGYTFTREYVEKIIKENDYAAVKILNLSYNLPYSGFIVGFQVGITEILGRNLDLDGDEMNIQI